MIIILKQQISEAKRALSRISSRAGFKVKEIVGQEETVLGAVGTNRMDIRRLRFSTGLRTSSPYRNPTSSLPGK
jgi:hypothetical protein